VDDNRLLADAMERRLAFTPELQWAGWISDTLDAVEAIARAKPDVVLLDIDMPGRDCFEIVREVAREDPEIKIVMFSGYIRPEYIDRAIEAGAWGYLSKNEEMDEVVSAILRVARGDFVLSPEVQSSRVAEA
jgi:two-component system response regulator DesR